jgi:hypothetical protein
MKRSLARHGLAGMAAMAGLAVMATACGAGAGSGDRPYYGAGDSRQPFAPGPPSTVANTPTALGRSLVDGSGRTCTSSPGTVVLLGMAPSRRQDVDRQQAPS